MKTYVITPLFCKAMLFYDQLEHMRRTQLFTKDIHHVVVNDHYPIDYKLNGQLLWMFAKEYGCQYLNEGKGNRGMQSAINYALKIIQPEDDDVIILSDVDDRAEPESYEALVRVIRSDDSIAVAALSFPQIDINASKLNPIPEIKTGPHFGDSYWVHPNVDQWHIAAYRFAWIKSIGGFGQAYPYWGGLESYLYSKFKPQGKVLVYLTSHTCRDLSQDPKFRDHKLFFDPEFKEYKKHIHTTQYKGSFSEWLTKQS